MNLNEIIEKYESMLFPPDEITMSINKRIERISTYDQDAGNKLKNQINSDSLTDFFEIMKQVSEVEMLMAIKELLKDIKNNIDLVASEINHEEVDTIMQITTDKLHTIGEPDQLRIKR